VERDGPATRAEIVLLCSDNPAARIMFHFLRNRFGPVAVIQEQRVSQRTLLRRRIKRLGLRRAAGQLLFRSIVVPWLGFRSRGRIEGIKREHALDDGPMHAVIEVGSMNDEHTRRVLRDLQPAITVVCGTRILDRDTLSALNGPVVNFHAGITPLYRGVHGGYWALVEGRRELVGSTLHLIDEGIDTGEIIAQPTFEVTAEDNFATYPYLHLVAVLPDLERVVRQACAGEALRGEPLRTDLPSKLRTHPTIGEYVRHARAGVR
jgi:methionyl-tRNA formyltransferase